MPRKPKPPGPDFSADAGRGLPTGDALRRDLIDEVPLRERYRRIWQEYGVPFALLKARNEYRKVGVALPADMVRGLDDLLDKLGDASDADVIPKIVTGGTGQHGNLATRMREQGAAQISALLGDLCGGGAKDADAYRFVIGLLRLGDPEDPHLLDRLKKRKPKQPSMNKSSRSAKT